MMQRFVRFEDIKTLPLAISGKKIIEDPDDAPVSFDTKTWNDIAPRIWDYHYDILRTMEYHPPLGKTPPYRPRLKATVFETTSVGGGTEVYWEDAWGVTQTITLVGGAITAEAIEEGFVGDYSYNFISGLRLGEIVVTGGPLNMKFFTVNRIRVVGDGTSWNWFYIIYEGDYTDPVLWDNDPFGDYPRAHYLVITGGNGGGTVTVTRESTADVIAQLIVNFRSLAESTTKARIQGFNLYDKRAQILSALRYKEQWDAEFTQFRNGYMALVIAGVPTAYHDGELPDNDFRWGTHTYDSADHGLKQHGNPFGLLIEGYWVRSSRTVLTPTGSKDISYTFVDS